MKKFLKFLTTGAVFISRLGLLPPNFSPVGAFGFFSSNPVFFIVNIVAFDYFIGGFYRGFWFNYLGFGLYWLIGRLATNNFKLQIFSLPLASFLFFAVSNFGVWWYWHPHTAQGLFNCYLLAVPFYRQTLLGDLVFGYGYLFSKKYLNKIIKRFTRNLSPAICVISS